jgi:hypothetical protein
MRLHVTRVARGPRTPLCLHPNRNARFPRVSGRPPISTADIVRLPRIRVRNVDLAGRNARIPHNRPRATIEV